MLLLSLAFLLLSSIAQGDVTRIEVPFDISELKPGNRIKQAAKGDLPKDAVIISFQVEFDVSSVTVDAGFTFNDLAISVFAPNKKCQLSFGGSDATLRLPNFLGALPGLAGVITAGAAALSSTEFKLPLPFPISGRISCVIAHTKKVAAAIKGLKGKLILFVDEGQKGKKCSYESSDSDVSTKVATLDALKTTLLDIGFTFGKWPELPSISETKAYTLGSLAIATYSSGDFDLPELSTGSCRATVSSIGDEVDTALLSLSLPGDLGSVTGYSLTTPGSITSTLAFLVISRFNSLKKKIAKGKFVFEIDITSGSLDGLQVKFYRFKDGESTGVLVTEEGGSVAACTNPSKTCFRITTVGTSTVGAFTTTADSSSGNSGYWFGFLAFLIIPVALIIGLCVALVMWHRGSISLPGLPDRDLTGTALAPPVVQQPAGPVMYTPSPYLNGPQPYWPAAPPSSPKPVV